MGTGNGPLPLVQSLIKAVPEQEAKQSFGRGRLVTDEWMRVKVRVCGCLLWVFCGGVRVCI
jgi:hypothetical protein